VKQQQLLLSIPQHVSPSVSSFPDAHEVLNAAFVILRSVEMPALRKTVVEGFPTHHFELMLFRRL